MDISLGLHSLKEECYIFKMIKIEKLACLSRSSASLSFAIDSRCLASACATNNEYPYKTFQVSFVQKRRVNCPNIFSISLTFSINSRCLELLWSPCICRSEDPWKSLVGFLIVLKTDAGHTSEEGIHLKASHVGFSSQETCVQTIGFRLGPSLPVWQYGD